MLHGFLILACAIGGCAVGEFPYLVVVLLGVVLLGVVLLGLPWRGLPPWVVWNVGGLECGRCVSERMFARMFASDICCIVS